MTTGRFNRRLPPKPPSQHRAVAPSEQLFLGAILAGSLVLHLVVGALVLSGINFGRFKRTPLVTMRVDLVSAPPVVAPKRGEGGAVAVAVKAPPPPTVKAVAPVAKRSEVLVPTKSKKPVKPEKKSAASDDELRQSLAAMRQRREAQAAQAEVDAEIARLKAGRTKAKVPTPPKADAGTPDGIGAEAGGAISEWTRNGLQSKWNLSKYQLTTFDLLTKVVIEYDKSGKLIRFELKSRSGNKVFDDSIVKALKAFSEVRLPASYLKNLKGNFSQEITLTPKDLQD